MFYADEQVGEIMYQTRTHKQTQVMLVCGKTEWEVADAFVLTEGGDEHFLAASVCK